MLACLLPPFPTNTTPFLPTCTFTRPVAWQLCNTHLTRHITTLFPQNTQAHKHTVQQAAPADSSGPEPRLPLLQQLCEVQLVDVGGNDEVILRQTTCSNNQHSTSATGGRRPRLLLLVVIHPRHPHPWVLW